MKDKLEKMFDMQVQLMNALGVYDPQSRSKQLQPALASNYLEAASGMVCESAEVLELVTKMTRPWKAKMFDTIGKRYAALVEEITDVLFYSVELLIHLGLSSEDLMFQFARKNAIVNARILASTFSRDEIFNAMLHMKQSNAHDGVFTIVKILTVFGGITEIDFDSLSEDPEGYVIRMMTHEG